MSNEIWKHVATTKRTEKFVSNMGRCKTVWKRSGRVRIHYGTLNPYLGYRFWGGLGYVHRIVVQAFLGHAAPGMQVDHINGNREDNRVENLRWVTRSENNSSPVSRLMRSIHRQSVRHDDEIIEATGDDGEVKYYATGTSCARALKCSSPLIYNVLNGKSSARRARGWSLRWVPLSSVVGQEVK